MKAIMISIKPKWCAKIMNGEKTIEIRKTMPKCNLPIDVYIYCTKEDSLSKLIDYPKNRYVCEQNFKCDDFPKLHSGYEGKGKVVAKFTLNKVEEIEIVYSQENEFGGYSESYGTKTLSTDELLKKSQLDYFKLAEYLKDYTPFGYAWHISNLEIFDKPKNLSEFSAFRKPYWNKKTRDFVKEEQKKFGCHIFRVSRLKSLTKAPQSWCYVEEEYV